MAKSVIFTLHQTPNGRWQMTKQGLTSLPFAKVAELMDMVAAHTPSGHSFKVQMTLVCPRKEKLAKKPAVVKPTRKKGS